MNIPVYQTGISVVVLVLEYFILNVHLPVTWFEHLTHELQTKLMDSAWFSEFVVNYSGAESANIKGNFKQSNPIVSHDMQEKVIIKHARIGQEGPAL